MSSSSVRAARKIAARKRKALAWCGSFAGAIFLFSGLAVLANKIPAGPSVPAVAEGAPPSANLTVTPQPEPLPPPAPLAGVAKVSRTRPVSVARAAPAPAELVGWARVHFELQTPSPKATNTRPEATARSRPVVGERIAWAKEGLHAAVPVQTERQLSAELALAPEVALGHNAQAVLRSWSSNVKNNLGLGSDGRVTDNSPLLLVRPDLASLPMRGGTSAQLAPRAALTLATLSRKLNAYIDGLAPRNPDGTRTSPKNLEQVLLEEKRGKRPEWLRVEAVPTLLQILMHEDRPLRRLLVDLLAQIQETPATVALARRALFDLDPEIRSVARSALKGRNPEDYRPILLGALRYPWAPAAWHAAEALVELKARDVVPNLVTLLDQPDPAGVQTLKKRYAVTELVKVLHTRNCLLCHAPSESGNDVCMKTDPWLKRRTVLTVKQASQMIASGQLSPAAIQSSSGSGGRGYGGGGGSGGGCVTAQTDLMIRFDVTFLRQDFSIQSTTAGPGTSQRFDYVVRTRYLTREQANRLTAQTDPKETYPQRDAVLFALTRLTGQDAGVRTAAWKKIYPDAEVEVEARQLVGKLLKAGPLELPILLKNYSEGKGDAYTRALRAGVARLSGSAREQTRDALERRLAGLEVAREK